MTQQIIDATNLTATDLTELYFEKRDYYLIKDIKSSSDYKKEIELGKFIFIFIFNFPLTTIRYALSR